ncbi:DNA-binding protein [Acinetobacter rudis]|uniref:DNA-binding protein n=1 Tax=Acinetobacter rudis TaxID=632955 RepID=UPI00280E10DE|nr:DNA-binding protein [Acinetobacter rudis]MDQ8951981.1 DNA-binding protein [Acinetobacter rudis]
MAKLTKLDQISPEERLSETQRFWVSPDDALFPSKTIALVFDVSIPWLQLKRCTGDGIPYVKSGPRRVLYKKKDAVEFFNKKTVLHTTMQSSH